MSQKGEAPKDLNDWLDRSVAAGSFAEKVNSSSDESHQVFAVTGVWGSGKTFYVELAEREIGGKLHWIPSWALGDSESLVHEINVVITHSLKSLKTNKQRREFLTSFNGLLSASGVAISTITSIQWMSIAGKLIGHIFEWYGKNKEIESRQTYIRKVSKELCKNSKPIWIVIDDIDRMEPHQVREIFRLISTTYRLPFLKFILLFDWNYVTSCMEAQQISQPEEFLTKIIDFREDLPATDVVEIAEHFYNELANIFPDSPDLPCKGSKSDGNWQEILPIILPTLRHINKLLELVRSRKESLSFGGVQYFHPCDLTLLMILQMRCEKMYYFLQELDDGWACDSIRLSRLLFDLKDEPGEWFTKFTVIKKDFDPQELDAFVKILTHLRPDLDWATGKPLSHIESAFSTYKRYSDSMWRPVYRKRSLNKIPLLEEKWESLCSDLDRGHVDLSRWLGQSADGEESFERSCCWIRANELTDNARVNLLQEIVTRCFCRRERVVNLEIWNKLESHFQLFMHIVIGFNSKSESFAKVVKLLQGETILAGAVGGYVRFHSFDSRHQSTRQVLESATEIAVQSLIELKADGKHYDDGGWSDWALQWIEISNGHSRSEKDFMSDDLLLKSYVEKFLVRRMERSERPFVDRNRADDKFANRFVSAKIEWSPEAKRLRTAYEEDLACAQAYRPEYFPDNDHKFPFG